LERTKNIIKNITGKEPRLFRPPYSIKTSNIFRASKKLNLSVVSWDVFPRDYNNPGAQKITDFVLEKTKPGSIIVLHDGGGIRNQTIEALPRIIEGLKKRGYEFVTVSGLG
jgi:peptidoglycan/xylan/chitin deacetylase (PgdA/CDA1 family)